MIESTRTPADWSTADSASLAAIRGVCLDIDDTLSTDGKLTADAYRALWRLKDSGFALVPITGRPAGWCDHFARFWPVDAVVGENGAFTFFMDQGVRRRVDTPSGASPSELKERLQGLSQGILAQFPEARFASDQAYREFDLAIDVCEDVPEWPTERVDALLSFCRAAGANAKLSSIHVNTWYGDYDKRQGFEHWVKLQRALPSQGEWLYIGDSPNDESMFEAFQYTVGVSNLKRYLDRLKTPPRWLTSRASGAGFAEMAERLIRAKRPKA